MPASIPEFSISCPTKRSGRWSTKQMKSRRSPRLKVSSFSRIVRYIELMVSFNHSRDGGGGGVGGGGDDLDEGWPGRYDESDPEPADRRQSSSFETKNAAHERCRIITPVPVLSFALLVFRNGERARTAATAEGCPVGAQGEARETAGASRPEHGRF